jgi:hypothetical protein
VARSEGNCIACLEAQTALTVYLNILQFFTEDLSWQKGFLSIQKRVTSLKRVYTFVFCQKLEQVRCNIY